MIQKPFSIKFLYYAGLPLFRLARCWCCCTGSRQPAHGLRRIDYWLVLDIIRLGIELNSLPIGGGNASPTQVSTCSALEAALGATGPAVVTFSGTLSACGIIDIESDKTVLGVGSNA